MKPIVIKYRQAGVGLVEIMIAMVIGLFVIGGLTQIFLSNKQGFRVQEAQSRLQESARLVSILLSSTISKAESQRNAQQDPQDVFGAALAITGTENAGPGGTLTGTDTITIRFQRDGIITDCLGSDGISSPQNAATAPGTIAVNIYRVDNNNQLDCNNGVINGFQPLLDNVENMQILYGEDTNANGSVDQYVTADNVTDFDDVLSVYMAVLIASDADVKPAADNRTYNLLGTDVTMPATGNDRIQRRIVERIIALRNRLR